MLVQESQRVSGVLHALNATFLTLIPKEEKVVDPNKFCPIVLCNVIYKIISKVIALRLKPLLPTLVASEQSGYVEGRQILDNILLADGVGHSLKATKTPWMLIKLDMSKAFDNSSRKSSLPLDSIRIGSNGSWASSPQHFFPS